jgi:manganese efflux pump family protein
MDFIYVLLISIALAMDCFAISVCMSSLSGVKIFDYFKIPLHFGLFHIAMIFLGYYVGIFFRQIIQGIDHWVAFVLLTGIGIKIIVDSIRHEKKLKKPTSEGTLLLLSLATSIDALAIGITFAFTSMDIQYSSMVLGITVFVISFLGLLLGEKLHKLNLKYAGVVGGAVLVVIGLKTLITHLIG